MPYLQYLDQLRQLGPGVLTVGSGTEAIWRVLNHDLASLHAILTLERDGRALVQVGNPDATIIINDREIEGDRARLEFNDVMRLGSAKFVYRQTAQDVDPTVRYLRDTRRGRSFRLAAETRLGRDPRCTILIQDPEVSRQHAEVRFREGRYFLAPVGDAYVLLNGTRIHHPEPLAEGDEVGVGRTQFTFSAEPGAYDARVSGDHANIPGDRRAGQMKTTYMGAVEVRERIRERESRHVWLIVTGLAAAVVLLWVLLTW